MAINFPDSPSNGDIHTVSGKRWQWDGEKWQAYGASLAADVLFVDQANSRVGINDTTPSYGLDVNGTARVTGAITASGGVVGNVTGNASGTALTVTQAAQSAITSVGTLTSATITGDLTVDTSTLKVDATNNRVGIGTTTPVDGLEVDAGGTGSASAGVTATTTETNGNAHFRLKNDAHEWKVLLNGAQSDKFMIRDQTNAAMRLVIDTSGNVGIGTTSPGYPLEVYRTGGNYENIRIVNTAAGALYRSTDSVATTEMGTQAGSAVIRTANTVRLAVTAAGNVGIGTASPTNFGGVNTHVYNTTIASLLVDNGTYVGEFYASSSGVILGARSNHALKIVTNDTARMTITNAGNVGIGQSSPAYRCDINEDTADAVPLRVEMSSGGTANQYLARFTRNTGLLTNGIYCDTTNAYFGTPSDERIKRDITSIDPADSLAAITALRPVDYRYIADPDDGEIRNGLIAQEVEPLIPAAVHTVIETEPRMETVSVPRVEIVVDDDGNETTVPVLDEDGNQIIDEDTRPVLDDDGKRIMDTTGDSKMLSWDAVNAHMVGAIKELTARIAALESA